MRNVVIFAKSCSMEMDRCSFNIHFTAEWEWKRKRLDDCLIPSENMMMMPGILIFYLT